MAVLPTGFGKSLPFQFGKSTTNKNNKWQIDCMQSTSSSSWLIALMQDQVEGMSKIPDMKTAYAGH
jgi:superfamily II DNA helicase RecQ